MAGLFGYSRQAYYKEKKNTEARRVEEEVIILLINKVRKRMPRIGGKKTYHVLKEELNRLEIKIGRDKFFDLLRENRLLIECKKKYQMTTNSKHMFKKYPNLIKDLKVNRRDQVWVSDITYIRTDEGFSYAAMITDVFTEKLVFIDKTMSRF